MDRFDEGPNPHIKKSDTTSLIKAKPANTEFGLILDSFIVTKNKIKPNEFLANILLPHHIDYVTIDALAKKSKDIFDVRKMVVGKNYTILASKDSIEKAQYFIYQPNAISYIVYD